MLKLLFGSIKQGRADEEKNEALRQNPQYPRLLEALRRTGIGFVTEAMLPHLDARLRLLGMPSGEVEDLMQQFRGMCGLQAYGLRTKTSRAFGADLLRERLPPLNRSQIDAWFTKHREESEKCDSSGISH